MPSAISTIDALGENLYLVSTQVRPYGMANVKGTLNVHGQSPRDVPTALGPQSWRYRHTQPDVRPNECPLSLHCGPGPLLSTGRHGHFLKSTGDMQTINMRKNITDTT